MAGSGKKRGNPNKGAKAMACSKTDATRLGGRGLRRGNRHNAGGRMIIIRRGTEGVLVTSRANALCRLIIAGVSASEFETWLLVSESYCLVECRKEPAHPKQYCRAHKIASLTPTATFQILK